MDLKPLPGLKSPNPKKRQKLKGECTNGTEKQGTVCNMGKCGELRDVQLFRSGKRQIQRPFRGISLGFFLIQEITRGKEKLQ